MKTHSVQLLPLGKTLRIREGTPLTDVLFGFGVEFPCGGKGTCGRCRIRLLEGKIPVDDIHARRLQEKNLEAEWRLACMSTCQSDLVLEVEQFDSVIQADDSSFPFEASEGLGIAFDVGTTTLVGQLLDLKSGKVLAVETALNPQRKYGNDLISRLEASLSGDGQKMTRMIREKVGAMAGRLMQGHDPGLRRMVLVGNTVMHHFFCGHDPSSLAYYPFHSAHMGKASFTSDDLGWEGLNCVQVEFYPSVGSFVGSDILAGILATGIHRKDACHVLVDLGTNGEIVAGSSEGLICASTAAGPAFEGARISQGMHAHAGAIASIHAEETGWRCQVIGNGPSRGICGSGLIDAMAIFRKKGLIGDFGEILSGKAEIDLDGRVRITQRDIQEFQLAKAAIAAGIDILLQALGKTHAAVERVYVSGGFGNYINPDHVAGIGMLEFPPDRIRKLGNSALLGAKMFLFEQCKDPEKILEITRHLNLESVADFQDIFVDRLSFIRK